MDKSNRQPKISIVITAYNSEQFIRASVSSALAQSYPDFEVVVVNDGSSDRTEEICATIYDDRLRYLNKGRLGRARALNEGIDAATGEYIAINDADDLSLPYRLECSMSFAQAHPELAFLGTAYIRTTVFHDEIPEEAQSACKAIDPDRVRWLSPSTVYRRNIFVNSTLLYPKAIWKQVAGYDERLPLSEDYDFQLRALQFGQAAILPCHTVLWYFNPNSYFKQKSRREQVETIRFIRSRALRSLNLPTLLRFYHPIWRMTSGMTRACPPLLKVVNSVRTVVAKELIIK